MRRRRRRQERAPARVAAGNRRDASAAARAPRGSAASHALLGAAHIRAADASCKITAKMPIINAFSYLAPFLLLLVQQRGLRLHSRARPAQGESSWSGCAAYQSSTIFTASLRETSRKASIQHLSKWGKGSAGVASCLLAKFFPGLLLGKIIGSHTKINAEKNGLLVGFALIPARLFR